MPFSTKLIRELDKLQPDLKAVMLEMLSEIERNREESITRKEFLEFARNTEENFQKVWQSIDKLAQAQERTEQRLEQLAIRVDQLAEAQQRTEERVNQLAEAQQRTDQRLEQIAKIQQRTEERLEKLAASVDELAKAQERTEARMGQLAKAQERTEARMGQLAKAQERTEARMDQLAKAQERTEARMDQLAKAQERTEAQMGQLAKAQERTEKALATLAGEHSETRRQLGGISDAVGYTLEDRAYLALPKLLEKDYGITLEEELIRDFVEDNEGEKIEVNILGRGRQNGNEILIIGESKSQLSKNNIDEFIRKKLKRLKGTHPHLFPVVISYMISEPDVKTYARQKGIAIYLSYQFRPMIL